MERTRKYYEKYGNKLLLISYFIPGVRQVAGYFAGIIRVPFRAFALYAYTGSAFWVLVFIGIGYYFGDQWHFVFVWVERFLKYIFIGLGVVLVGILLFKWRKRMKIRG